MLRNSFECLRVTKVIKHNAILFEDHPFLTIIVATPCGIENCELWVENWAIAWKRNYSVYSLCSNNNYYWSHFNLLCIFYASLTIKSICQPATSAAATAAMRRTLRGYEWVFSNIVDDFTNALNDIAVPFASHQGRQSTPLPYIPSSTPYPANLSKYLFKCYALCGLWLKLNAYEMVITHTPHCAAEGRKEALPLIVAHLSY